MNKYKHKKTGTIADLSGNNYIVRKETTGEEYKVIPREYVEDSCDWKK